MMPLAGASTRVSRAALPLARSRASAAASRARAVATACCEVLKSRSAIAPALNSDSFCSSVHCALASSARAATRSASALARAALLLARLEPREQLSGAHLLALAHVHRLKVALDPGADVDRLDRTQVAGERDAVLDRRRRHRGDVGRRERDRRRGAATTTTAAATTRRHRARAFSTACSASAASARRGALLGRRAAVPRGVGARGVLGAGGRERE